ncbi:ATP-binding protein [Umezawaea endophytica]|uniref:ATP-binding protein n=1 Tax=Umezawaea endophytica TaxID=1654476 RepID=A0A9X2VXN7_9PSEU|nr:ATP-binding protein [Umezawaea endophytica]MCS7484795.1 ATP-binding protein [Umezawaea endophytica]
MLNEPATPVAVVLPAESGSCSRARRLVDEAVTSWGLPEEFADDAALVVTELVSNGADHAEGPLRLTVNRTEGGVRIEVHDRSSALPVVRPVSPESPRGRGMIIVNALSDSWGVEPDADGKTVWAELVAK